MIELDRPQAVLLADAVATAAVTNLVGASWASPANAFKLGQVWRFSCWAKFLHTAATTPTLTLELAVGGVAFVTALLTPPATAATFVGRLEGLLTVRAAGVSGSIVTAVEGLFSNPSIFGSANLGAAAGFDTTSAKLVELRVRMTTAVASNTLTLTQGMVERVVG